MRIGLKHGITVLVLTASGLVGVLVTAGTASAASGPGPFHESGNVIYDAAGAPFIPHGITVSGLENSSWQKNEASDKAMIAAAPSWGANLIRFQVDEYGYTHWAGLASALATEVHQAEALGLAVAINDNDEWDAPGGHGYPEPTAASEAFWRKVAPRYQGDSQVIFDIFNEPRTHSWACWHNGGCGAGYIGMQTLAKYVRALAPRTWLWIDGPGTLDKLASGHWWIGASNPKSYSIHHPPGAHDAANWLVQYGYLVTRHLAAVTDGEWTNWAANRGECWADAPTAVPAYLAWMRSLGIGMTVWTLKAPTPVNTRVLMGSNYTSPSTIKSNWSCTNGLGQSAGALIKAAYQS